MNNPDDETQAATPMERLASFTKKLIGVPKEEINAKEREYNKRKRDRKRKRPHR